jgi:ABC-type transporter MlaC component
VSCNDAKDPCILIIRLPICCLPQGAFGMKKSLTTLFALAFAMMFGLVHVASAMKHEAPAAPAAAEAKKEAKEEKKEMKKEKKMKKKAAKKEAKEMKGAAPATPAAPAK